MPKMDGMDVLKSLKDVGNRDPELKILVVCALMKPKLVEEFHPLGINRVLTNPFRFGELIDVVEELVSPVVSPV